jgi:MoaA/NifB/PqqE/SkfB family radical SAM enzyme
MLIDQIKYHSRLLLANTFNTASFLPSKILPLRVDFKITENCNAKCVICDHWKKRSEDRLTTDNIIAILKKIASLKIKVLRLTGGEALLRKDLFVILRKFSDNDFKVVLATNGLLLNKYADQINDSIINNVKVSIDGLWEKNDVIRGVNGYYKTAMEGLKHIRKKVTIASVLNNYLVDDLENLIKFCRDHGYNYDVHLPSANTYFHQSEEVQKFLKQLWPTIPNIYKAFDILEKYNILSGTVLDNARAYMLKGRFAFQHCILGFIKLYIDSQGNVRTGCYEYNPVGNLIHSSFEEIINSPEYHNSVIDMFNLKCRGCTCGYAISATYDKPFDSLKYLKKRMKEIN